MNSVYINILPSPGLTFNSEELTEEGRDEKYKNNISFCPSYLCM